MAETDSTHAGRDSQFKLLQVLKDTTIANPLRNQHLLDMMNTLEKHMGRAVAHKPKMLSEESLMAMLEEVSGGRP